MKFDEKRAAEIIKRLNAEICDKLNITEEELNSMDLTDIYKIIEERPSEHRRMRLRINHGHLS